MQKMRIELAFGKTGLEAELPEGLRYQFLEARSAVALADGAAGPPVDVSACDAGW